MPTAVLGVVIASLAAWTIAERLRWASRRRGVCVPYSTATTLLEAGTLLAGNDNVIKFNFSIPVPNFGA
jgi:hypothetical protein